MPAALGVIGEPVYRIVVRARNRSFDRGRRVTRVRVPVISVGNLSVGGTGKTPFVMMVVEMLRGMGVRPAIAMRGYKAPRDGAGDEEAEYRDRLGDDVPIVAQPDRASGIGSLLRERGDIGCVVLDDGFQHRFIARDLDIVLVDATRDPFADHCLPRGWLREPVESLGRAGVVAITRTNGVEEAAVARMEERIGRCSSALVVRAAHGWEAVDVREGEEDRAEPATWLSGERVVAACAIGNSGAFVGQLRDSGAGVVASVIERDHHQWRGADIERMRRLVGETGARAVVTTGKDWVKLRGLEPARLGVPIARPRVRMDILKGGEALHGLVAGAGAGTGSGANRA